MLTLDNIHIEREGRPLLQEVSTSLTPGQLTVVIGPNGSGKTSLLKLLSGIWPANRGSLSFHSARLDRMERRERSRLISYVPQSPLPSFPYSVFDIVSMGLYPHGENSTDRIQVEGALRTVEAWHLKERPITELSGGERQRVYLARGLVAQAPILLLDEPTANLDIGHQQKIWELLRKQADYGRLVLLATHDLFYARLFADHALLLADGQKVEEGTPDEVLNDEKIASLFGLQPLLDGLPTPAAIPTLLQESAMS